MRLKAIQPVTFPWFDYSKYSFSLGLTSGKSIFLSGHSASEFDASIERIVVNGDIEEQTRTAYRKISQILDAAGHGIKDIVRIVEYVTVEGLSSYPTVQRTRAELLDSVNPAVNVVVVQRLLRSEALIEVEVIAERDSKGFGVDPANPPSLSLARAAGGTVYLSTIHPYDQNGELVGEGDIVEQTRQIFLNAESILKTCGLSLSHVVKTLEMIRPEGLSDYRHTGRIRKEYLGPVYPGAAGIVQQQVAPDDRVLISYDFTASVHLPEPINPGWERYERLAYSPAVRAGNMLFMSGQAALDPETEQAVHAGDIVSQTNYTYRNIIKVLEAAGLGAQNLIKTIEYVTPEGLPRYRETAAVRKLILSEPYPASTGAVCHSLLRPEFEIEIDPTAIFFEDD